MVSVLFMLLYLELIAFGLIAITINWFQICLMLNSLENYVWRYNSAVELVNLIFTYIEQNALRVYY